MPIDALLRSTDGWESPEPSAKECRCGKLPLPAQDQTNSPNRQ